MNTMRNTNEAWLNVLMIKVDELFFKKSQFYVKILVLKWKFVEILVF